MKKSDVMIELIKWSVYGDAKTKCMEELLNHLEKNNDLVGAEILDKVAMFDVQMFNSIKKISDLLLEEEAEDE